MRIGTGYEGKVENARGYSLVWSGPGHQDVHGDERPPDRRARADAVRDLGQRRRLLVRPHEEPLSGRARPALRGARAAAARRLRRARSRTAATAPTCPELDRLVRAGIADAGYPGQPSHPIAHGVGARAHEPPYAHQAGSGTIRTGMVLAIEPGHLLGGRRRPARRGQLADHRRRAREAVLASPTGSCARERPARTSSTSAI